MSQDKFDPDYTRGRMDELQRQRSFALWLLILGCIGFGLMFCALLAAPAALMTP